MTRPGARAPAGGDRFPPTAALAGSRRGPGLGAPRGLLGPSQVPSPATPPPPVGAASQDGPAGPSAGGGAGVPAGVAPRTGPAGLGAEPGWARRLAVWEAGRRRRRQRLESRAGACWPRGGGGLETFFPWEVAAGSRLSRRPLSPPPAAGPGHRCPRRPPAAPRWGRGGRQGSGGRLWTRPASGPRSAFCHIPSGVTRGGGGVCHEGRGHVGRLPRPRFPPLRRG